MPTNSLKDQLFAIGEEIVACSETCPGFVGSCKKAQSQGIAPRGFFFDKAIDERPNGILFIGSNPGPASPLEKKLYIEKGLTYEAVLDYCGSLDTNFYERTKAVADGLDALLPPNRRFGHNRVWTDLVKCQDGTRHTDMDILRAFRTCRKYLDGEITLLTEKKNYRIVALGNEARNFLGAMLKRPFIAIPHPSRNHSYYKNLSTILKKRKDDIRNFWEGKAPSILELNKKSRT
ncbi:MAG TPA: uracil-DNA glycosylase family protein [bacterium]|nr:uracil-DNA glycosylase family protein [bacterium]